MVSDLSHLLEDRKVTGSARVRRYLSGVKFPFFLAHLNGNGNTNALKEDEDGKEEEKEESTSWNVFITLDVYTLSRCRIDRRRRFPSLLLLFFFFNWHSSLPSGLRVFNIYVALFSCGCKVLRHNFATVAKEPCPLGTHSECYLSRKQVRWYSPQHIHTGRPSINQSLPRHLCCIMLMLLKEEALKR